MTKLKSVIEAVRKDENLSQVAQSHLGDLLDNLNVKKDLRLVFHVIASHVVDAIEDPSEARKYARECMMAFENEVDYWIKNKKGEQA
jgi:hypothetical protein